MTASKRTATAGEAGGEVLELSREDDVECAEESDVEIEYTEG